MKKITKQQRLMTEVKNELTQSDIKDFKDMVDKGDSTKDTDMEMFGMTEEEYNTDVEAHDKDEFEEDKHAKNRGPGGIKLSEEQIEAAAKMMAETEAYLQKREGSITFSDLTAFPQDKETIKNAYKARAGIQKCRIQTGNQMSGITRLAAYKGKDRHPIAIMAAYHHLKAAEELLDKNLKQYASMYAVGVWAQSICGIGPVFAASLVAMLELGDRKYPGQFWSYAGLSGRPDWDIRRKGSKVQYNPDLKTLCFKISASFMKMKGKEDCYYGHLIDEMIEVYTKRNEEGGFKDLAEFYLNLKNWDPEKPTYKTYASGKLPKSHIVMMARRYAVKRFLAHLFEAFWYAEHYYDGLKDKCPEPYVEAHLGHHDIVHAPNLEIIDQWYQNNGYSSLMSDIDDQVVNEEVDINDLQPENEAEAIIVDAYKKGTGGKHRVKMRLRMKKVGSKEEPTDTAS